MQHWFNETVADGYFTAVTAALLGNEDAVVVSTHLSFGSAAMAYTACPLKGGMSTDC